MKVYNMISQSFIKGILRKIQLHLTFIKWVIECINTSTFSFNLNGKLKGFFRSSYGIKQGNPLSPYLFVIAIEILSILLDEMVTMRELQYHQKCKAIKITHFCFANDLIIFYKQKERLVSLVNDALDTFQLWLGLRAKL